MSNFHPGVLTHKLVERPNLKNLNWITLWVKEIFVHK